MKEITSEDIQNAGLTRDEFSKRSEINYFNLSNKLAGRVGWKEEELRKGWEILENDEKQGK